MNVDLAAVRELGQRPKRKNKKRASLENVQQLQETIPLYSSVASGRKSADGQTRRAPAPSKQNKPRRGPQDQQNRMNPKHRSVAGQYFVRFATMNPNYPAPRPQRAPLYGAGPALYPQHGAPAAFPYAQQMANGNANGLYPANLYPPQIPMSYPMAQPPAVYPQQMAASVHPPFAPPQYAPPAANQYAPYYPYPPPPAATPYAAAPHSAAAPKSVFEATPSATNAVPVNIPQSDDGANKAVGAGKEQFGLCPMFGSAKGCRWGADCFFKHTDPNSVRFCPDFASPDGCYFGDSCFNRHQTFVFVKHGAPVPRFVPRQRSEFKEEREAM